MKIVRSLLAAAALLFGSESALAQAPRAPATAAEVPAPAAGDAEYKVSTSGHPYRVTFDPASRITFTAGLAGLHDGDGGMAAAFEAGLSIGYRKVYVFGTGEGQVTWQVEHRIPTGTVRPWVQPIRGVPSFDATLYRATLLRHSESPSIVLPFSPPLTIGFPFDVGLDAELGRVTVPITPVVLPGFEAKQPWIHVGVVRTSFLLDPWRSGKTGRSLTLGVGVRYDVDVYGAPTLEKPRFVHRVAPLTSGSARFRFQTDDGLLAIDVFGEAAPHWTSEDRWAFLANASARVDRTLIAINDQPIGAYAEVGYRYLPDGLGAPALHDVHGTLGISASLSLK